MPSVIGVNTSRCKIITSQNICLPADGKCVIYWMSRDQRAVDNYALLYASGIASSRGVPLKVVFNLVPRFLAATIRQYGFMIKGLKEVEVELRSKNIAMHLLMGDPVANIPKFAEDHSALAVIADFSPLRMGRGWVQAVGDSLDNGPGGIPLFQVDAHNIVPCWEASNKLEYGARTIRPKITNKIPEYLTDIPEVGMNDPMALEGCDPIDWDAALASLEIDRTIEEVDWIVPGTAGAMEVLRIFGESRLKDFGEKRNDPNVFVSSNMSPYLHFGQISAQRMVLYIKQLKKHASSTDSFVEEAVIRRELSDNFCYYNPQYDSLESCYGWAKETLALHRFVHHGHQRVQNVVCCAFSSMLLLVPAVHLFLNANTSVSAIVCRRRHTSIIICIARHISQ